MISAPLLTDLESCQRRGYFSRDWLPRRLHPTEITRRAIYAALCDEREDVGERAGEEVMTLCADVGLDIKHHNLHDIGLHHAAIADLVATWARGAVGFDMGCPQDKMVGNHTWQSSCLLDAHRQRLVRIVLVDHFSDERLLSESRSWYSLGEVAVYDAPMDVHVVSLGASRGGKRHSAWSKGLLHPRNRALRFKPHANKTVGFKDTWIPIYREEHDRISRETWLEAMEQDGMVRELTTVVHVERLSAERRKETLEVIERKADALSKIGRLPDPSYSQCDWPSPCGFRSVCFAPMAVTPAELGFRARVGKQGSGV